MLLKEKVLVFKPASLIKKIISRTGGFMRKQWYFERVAEERRPGSTGSLSPYVTAGGIHSP